MTTDAELDALFNKFRSKQGERGDIRHKLFQAYLETPPRREKLAKTLITVASSRLSFSQAKKRRWAEGGYGVESVLKEFEAFCAALDGTEKIDHAHVKSLLRDLRSTQAAVDLVPKKPLDAG